MTPPGAGPPHPVGAGHLRQPDLALSLGIQAELDHPAQQIAALPGDQPFHRIQRHRPARLIGEPGQPRRQADPFSMVGKPLPTSLSRSMSCRRYSITTRRS